MSTETDNRIETGDRPLALLQAFAGRWTTTGTVYASAETPELAVHGTDVYEWLPGEHFLLHRVDVIMGAKRVQSTEIIGYNTRLLQFVMHSYDDQGNMGIMHAFPENETWKFYGATERFSGAFSADGTRLNGVWEMKTGEDTWKPWMEISLQKQS